MRKSPLMALIASTLLVITTMSGKAVTYWDGELFTKQLSYNSQSTASGEFNIIDNGYNPNTQTVNYATVWFAVSDDQWLDENEWVEFQLDGSSFLKPIEVDLNLVGGEVLGSALVTLDSSGMLSYTIQATNGDFWALGAYMMAEAGPRAVPDGGATLMLLGGALAGIEALRRRAAGKLKGVDR